jgi:hypothetical protein
MQFEGSFADYDWNKWWHTKAEGKCLFFCWLILQNKVWTGDRINKHGGNADPVCKLCFTHQETALHMLVQCPFAKADGLALLHGYWLGINTLPDTASGYRRRQEWWRQMSMTGNQGNQECKKCEQKMIYTAWHIWKEWCRRAYDNKAVTTEWLQASIKVDVNSWWIAWGQVQGIPNQLPNVL